MQILDILTLPWPIFFLVTSIGAVVIYLLPTLVLAKSTKRSCYIFIGAAIVASLATSFVDQIYLYFHFPTPMGIYSGNVKNIVDLASIFSSGALWGAASGMFVIYKLNAIPKELATSTENDLKPITTSFMAAVIAFILVLPIAIATLVNPTQLTSSIAIVQKIFSSAPDKDISTGKNLLSFSHTVDIDVPEYPVIKFAADNSLFLIRNNDSELILVNQSTGKVLKKLDQLEGKHDQYEAQWSQDGRFFVLRKSGKEVEIPKEHYTRKQSLFKLFSLPDYKLISEFTHNADECFDLYSSQSMAFENDNNILWVICGHYYSAASREKVMAIRLTLPLLQTIDIRHHAEDTETLYNSAKEIARTKDSIITWQEGNHRESILITDLTHNKKLALLSNLTDLDRAGNLTMQSVRTNLDDNQISVIFCGNSSQVSDPQKQEVGKPTVHGFCRTLIFDIFSGQLLNKIDEVSNYVDYATSSVYQVKDSNLKIISEWEISSKAGVIKVVDATNGKELQKIETVAQRILSVSPDGQWLFTHAFNQKVIRVYRLNIASAS